jgi:hypothetical protein
MPPYATGPRRCGHASERLAERDVMLGVVVAEIVTDLSGK